MIRDCYQSRCGAVSPSDYFVWRVQTHAFEDMASWQWWGFNLIGERGELPETVTAAGGTWNLFSVFGVQAAYGRAFTESEDNLDGNTVMLTWSIFKRRFNGNPSIVGRQIHLDSKPYTVIGILPASFTSPTRRCRSGFHTCRLLLPTQFISTPAT